MAIGGNPLQFDSPTYSTGALAATKTFYADCSNTCASSRASVTVTINTQGAGTLTSVKSGPWTDASTWDANRVPAASDLVIISQGHTVTITGTVNAKNLTYRTTGKVTFSTAGSKLVFGQ